MNLKNFCPAVVLLVLVLSLHGDTAAAKTLRGPGLCPTLKIVNGVVRLRSKDRIARFACSKGFKTFGPKSLTCLQRRWDGIPPVCVKPGCSKVVQPKNGMFFPQMEGAVLRFFCNVGYRISGSDLLYCNGLRWNGTVPSCQAEITNPEMSCDFEKENLCGWKQNPMNNIDWIRQQLTTPSGHVGTGPSYDHTKGVGQDGYYMYIETSGVVQANTSAQLISPVFPAAASQDTCFIFWYHMYGATTGSLNVYQKLENTPIGSLQPLFTRTGEQGNEWIKGIVQLNVTYEPFQMIVEAVPGRGYLGDTGIDDFLLTNGSDCLEPIKQFTVVPVDNQTSGYNFSDYDDAQSCRGRCSLDAEPPPTIPDNPETPVMVTCDCHVNCMDNGTCCPDYSTYCVLGKLWQLAQTAPLSPKTTTNSSTIVGIVAGVALLLAVGVVGVACLRRRNVTSRRGGDHLNDDSDVRFLTADEVLDFSLARPADEDSGL